MERKERQAAQEAASAAREAQVMMAGEIPSLK